MKNPRLLQSTLAAVAITGLMAGSVARAASTLTTGQTGITNSNAGVLADDTDSGKHSCKGQNSCKGQGGCKTSDAGCKGKNTCKGKGGCKSA